jgi:hypothetical protein
MDVICMAVHKALCNLKLPKTAEVGYQRTKDPDTAAPIEIDTLSSIPNANLNEETGIQGLLRNNRSSKPKLSTQAYDFELKDTDAEHGDQLSLKEFIPIVITVNFVRYRSLCPLPRTSQSVGSYRNTFLITDRSKDVP